MVSEDGADGLHVLLGECRHQLADGGAEHLHHLAARDGEANDGRRLGVGLKDLWCRYHGWSPSSVSKKAIGSVHGLKPDVARFHAVLHAVYEHSGPCRGIWKRHAHGDKRAGAVRVEARLDVVVGRWVG